MTRQRIESKSVKLLLARIKKIMKMAKHASRRAKSSSAIIQNAIDAALNEEHALILFNTPVEKINADKRGIRTSLFRKAGYESIYSILQAGPQRLSAIKGISPNMAETAVRISQQISDRTRNSVIIRLNLDHQTPAYNNLVSLIDMHQQVFADEAISVKMLSLFPGMPPKEIRKLKRMNSRLGWYLWSDKKRESAINTYTALNSSIDEIERIGSRIVGKRLQRNSYETAWENFASHPIEFNNILERVASNKVSIDKNGYGIGEEIKAQVDSTPVLLDGLNCQLRGYQLWGVKYILQQRRVLLGDEMGLGKTIQALAAMVSIRNSGASFFLVLCPASVIENWCREIQSKSDLKAYNLHDGERDISLKSWLANGGVAVTNYESLQNHFSVPASFRIDMVVVDEAHFIKNAEARRSRNALAVCRRSDRLLFMTGTPLENNVEEMVGLMNHLQPQVARAANLYTSYSNAEEFKRMISPVYYRRKREDVLSELPELLEIKEWCHMTRDDELAYEDDILAGAFMQARRVSWSNSNYLHTSSKVQRMRELVEEARAEQRKVLIFSFFLETLEQIKNVFGSTCIGVISGAVPIRERQRVIDAFEQAPYGTVLAAQIQSGGTGLNIQTASLVIICEPQYKPSTENQAISRAYRMGQTRNVIVYRLLCPNTVDERITQILERKQRDFDTFADESIAAMRDSHLISDDYEISKAMQASVFAEEKKRIEEKRGLSRSSDDVHNFNSQPGYNDRTTEDLIDNFFESDASDITQEPVEDLTDTESKELRLTKESSSKFVCESCGKQVPDASIFCMYCGKPIIK